MNNTNDKQFLVLKNVTKAFGKTVVIDNLDLTIERGTMTTLLGPSGCGKTTILRLVSGLETPTSGQIFIDGEDVTKTSIQNRDICIVFQSYALFPHMSIADNVGYGLKMLGVAKEERQQQVEEALTLVDLAGFGSRYVDQISGGQQQRVALARALVLKPKVLLFDEPLSNLDANLRRSMRETIRELQQQFNITSMYVTHDQSEAFAVSDTVVVMKSGKIMQKGRPEELYRKPASLFMANFMGDANIFDTTYKDGKLDTFGYQITPDAITIADKAEGEYKLGIRPEAINLLHEGEAAQRCSIKRIVYMGEAYEVSVEWHGQELLLQLNASQFNPTMDKQAYLSFSNKGIFLLDKEALE
ncbi:MAG: ABC transporter ATP-binding protein [Gammaproteobacteria bacterium]|nr:MAG: ABC transporter ATP-binding protein [Gammaproteobacteria bacterium]